MVINLEELLLTVLPIVKEAGRIVADNWNMPHDIQHKGAIDLVTETDKAVEAYLREQLLAIVPDSVFLGEESAHDIDKMLLNSACWVVDPVDGTTNFVHHIPEVAVSVALCKNGLPVLGIVDAPMLDSCYCAVTGSGAFCNGNPIHVSAAATLLGAVVATGFPYDVKSQLPALLGRLERILPATQGMRRLGSAAIDLCYVAAGKLDAFFEDGLKPWDMAAGWLIVQEAGGKVTDFNGAEFKWGAPLLASNSSIHAEMSELLK